MNAEKPNQNGDFNPNIPPIPPMPMPQGDDPSSSLLPPKNAPARLLLKCLALGVILLLALIPLFISDSLINERENRAEGTKYEITSKWGGQQKVLPPVLALPYETIVEDTKKKEIRYDILLPRSLDVTGNLQTQIRKRGIYTVPIYTAQLQMNGTWNLEDLALLGDSISKYDFSKAKVFIGLSDCHGFRSLVGGTIDGKEVHFQNDSRFPVPSADDRECYYGDYYTDGRESAENEPIALFYGEGCLSVNFPIDCTARDREIAFSCPLDFAGSQALKVIPMGMTSTINLTSDWGDPSFQGTYLPIESSISSNKFSAKWKMANAGGIVSEDHFPNMYEHYAGVHMVEPVDLYTQVERSLKYGILVIMLTFLSIFFLELILRKQGVSVNLFHYFLSALALVLFYSLLLSISEFLGFAWAYLIAAVMVVGLNTLYFRLILKNSGRALVLGGIMTFLYIALFLLMRMETYALLVGSVALFIILAIVMVLSAKLIK